MKTITFFISLLFFVSFSSAQSIEDMLADDQPAQKTQIAKKTGSESELVKAIESIVGKKNTEFNVVYRAVESGDWNTAIIQYPKVFEGNSFYSSTNGLSVLAILQYHAGLKITALETLFKVSNPKDINPVFKKSY